MEWDNALMIEGELTVHAFRLRAMNPAIPTLPPNPLGREDGIEEPHILICWGDE
tara:strand:+ start:4030 stop:4191 length:162 start_codon:yes stop_codon:yes gene_type:complete